MTRTENREALFKWSKCAACFISDLLDRLGFARCQETGEGTQSYRLSVNEAALAETFIGAASAEPQIV